MKKKHDWNTWENYLRVHESVLKKYQHHFVSLNPKYSITELTDQYYQLKLDKLELKTLKGTVITINIEKDVEVQPGGSKKVARTVGYTYQAWIKGGNNLIRYCSPHETHNKYHHKLFSPLYTLDTFLSSFMIKLRGVHEKNKVFQRRETQNYC